MARILICAGDVTLESLLVVIAERMGHETDVLGAAPHDGPVRGDALVVDPTAGRATVWAQALRRADPGLPVVSIGTDWADPVSLGFRPTVVVPKPFALDQLRQAIDRALQQR